MGKTLEQVFDGEELLKITKDLVAIDSSTTCPARERNVAEYLLELFKKEGIRAWVQEVKDGRGNVIAVLKGDGRGKSLMLNGHMDTVPVTGMEDPFRGKTEDGWLWGRGTADMKGGLAAMAYALILLKRMEVVLHGDLVFAGVIEEEAATSAGSRHIAAHGPITDYAIVGEPTDLYPVTAHKGIDYFEVRFQGKAAHSSQPDNGVNAVYGAAEYIRLVREELAAEYKKRRHPLTGAPTVNAGLIRGSAGANEKFLKGEADTFAGIVPDQCTVWLDIRWTPCETVEGILKELRELAERTKQKIPGLQVEVHYMDLPRPAMEIGENEELTEAVREQVARYDPERAVLTGVSYFADSGILKGIGGIPSMILGPADIAVAHGMDERIEISQICGAARIYAGTALAVCGKQKEGIM